MALPEELREVIRVARACEGLERPPVLVGGWLPYLLAPEAPRGYLGTNDIDLALGWMLTDAERGEKFERIMLDLGALPKTAASSNDRSAIWDLPRSTPSAQPIILDFIAATEHTGPAEEIQVSGTRWMNAIAFVGASRSLLDRKITELIDDHGNVVSLHHLGVGGYVWSKAHAILGRKERRDDYALGYIIRWYPGGPREVAAELLRSPLKPALEEGKTCWANLRDRFADPNSDGARNYYEFDAQADSRPQTGAERREVSASVLLFLDTLGI